MAHILYPVAGVGEDYYEVTLTLKDPYLIIFCVFSHCGFFSEHNIILQSTKEHPLQTSKSVYISRSWNLLRIYLSDLILPGKGMCICITAGIE